MAGIDLEYGEEDLPQIGQSEKRALHKAFREKISQQGEDFGHFRLIYYFYSLARIDGLSPQEARRQALQ
jgi:hypothetical protein